MLQEQNTKLAPCPYFQIVSHLQNFLNRQIIGQEALIMRLLVALCSGGHLLVEGMPGLAKTSAIKLLSQCIKASFQRIQFTPDLLPSDLTGSDIYRPEQGVFHFEPGPLFHNIILADEINRAPAKVQSALLEAMAERQISIGRKTHPLPEFFMVMATQNPIEQEGTYPLPEAQLDRFLLYVKINYPPAEVEQKILALHRTESNQSAGIFSGLSQESIREIIKLTQKTHMSAGLEQYLLELILATREPARYGVDLAKWIRFGASPRATIGLDRAAKAHAWLQGRDYVLPEDIRAMAYDVLRHRIILHYEAMASGVDTDEVITQLLARIPVA
jgi:MoxR-like ATPase